MDCTKTCLFCGVPAGDLHLEGCVFHRERPASVFHWNRGYSDAESGIVARVDDEPVYYLGYDAGKRGVIEKILGERK